MLKRPYLLAIAGAAAVFSGTALCQQQQPGTMSPTPGPSPKAVYGSKTLNFACNLGSCKFLPKSDFAFGHIEMTFTGTLLVNGLQGKLTVTGNLRKEVEKYGRQGYFGTGKIVLDGKFRGFQWFGSDMAGTWTGDGLVRWYGDFDNNLETGKYWFANATTKKDWNTMGLTTEVPERIYKAADVPVVPQRRGG